MKLETLACFLLTMQLLGFISLSSLLATVVLSRRVNRHILFINFVFTFVLFNAERTISDITFFFVTTSEATEFSLQLIFGILDGCTGLIALTSTLNLVIHLWFVLRAAFYTETARAEKLRTFISYLPTYWEQFPS
ncbi:hypothetical protein K439DRAFT_869764 [Ramaria rubella]|nr:hypothetical protein K439DRAFT_869764 [Ramaria rubella]